MDSTRPSTVTRSAAAAAIALSLSAPLHGQVALRLAPSEGQVSHYVIESETSMSGAVMSTERIYRTETIARATGGEIEIRAVIDSASSTSAIPGAQTPDFSGMGYTFTVDGRSRVTGLTDAGTLSPEAEAVIRAMLGSSFFELPEGDVSPGDSWAGQVTTEIPAGMGGTLTMETDVTYTLAGLDGDLAEISLDGTVTMSGSPGGMPVDGTGDVSGTAIFDTNLSRLHSHESVMNVDVDGGGMSMSMQTRTTRSLVP